MILDKKEIGNRLYKIRHALGYGGDTQQTEYVEKYLSIMPGTYSKAETGATGFKVEYAAMLLERLPGLTLDWIYLGGFERLRDSEVVDKLRAAPDKKPLRRGKSRQPLSDEEAAALFAVAAKPRGKSKSKPLLKSRARARVRRHDKK